MTNVESIERRTQVRTVNFLRKVLSHINMPFNTSKYLQQRLHKTQQLKHGMMQELLMGKTRLI